MSRYTSDQIAICSVDSDGNIVDPITSEIINTNRLISVLENGKYFCFDIDTLYKEVQAGRPNNPYTRTPLSSAVLSEIAEYAKTLQLNINIYNVLPSIEINETNRIGDLIIAVGNDLPNRMEDLIYYRIETSSLDDLFDYSLMDPISYLNFGTEPTIRVTKGTLRRRSHIQSLYDYAYSVGRTGIADSLHTLYPEIIPYVETVQLTGPAVEQQRRIIEREQEAQLRQEQHLVDLSQNLENAVRNNNLEEVRRLISEGVPIIGISDEPLRLSIQENNPLIAQYLLNASDASREDVTSVQDFLYAQNGPERADMQTVLHSYLNRRTRENELIEAIQHQDIPAIARLLRRDMNVNFRFSLPLRTALTTNNLPIIRLLIEHGATLNIYPILSDAILAGRLDIVQYLVEHGANVYDSQGEALREAFSTEHQSIFDYLYNYMLDHPHQPLVNEPQVNPNEILEELTTEEVQPGDRRLIQTIFTGDVGEMLLLINEEGANFDGLDQVLGQTRHPEILRAAIAHGWNVDTDVGAALYAATVSNYIQNMMILIRAGADVNIGNGSLLHGAIVHRRVGATAILMANGANVNLSNYLVDAVEISNLEIIYLLINAGANIHANDNRALRLAIERREPSVLLALIKSDPDDPASRQILIDNQDNIDGRVLREIGLS